MLYICNSNAFEHLIQNGMKEKKRKRIKVKFKLIRMNETQQDIFFVYIMLFPTTLRDDESSVLFSLKSQ